MENKAWIEKAKEMFRIELARTNLSYPQLAERMRNLGYPKETPQSIAAKMHRGTFKFAWAMALAEALGSRISLGQYVRFDNAPDTTRGRKIRKEFEDRHKLLLKEGSPDAKMIEVMLDNVNWDAVVMFQDVGSPKEG